MFARALCDAHEAKMKLAIAELKMSGTHVFSIVLVGPAVQQTVPALNEPA